MILFSETTEAKAWQVIGNGMHVVRCLIVAVHSFLWWLKAQKLEEDAKAIDEIRQSEVCGASYCVSLARIRSML